MPFFADINLGLLHPLNVLFFLFEPFRALTVSVVILVGVALSGMYVFTREFHMPRPSVFISALAFGFSGSIIGYTNNVSILRVAVLLPWIMWLVTRYIDKPTNVRFAAASLCIAFQIVSGHPQITYITSLLVVSSVLYQRHLSLVRRCVLLLYLYGLAVLIASIQLMPFAELALQSTRIGRGYQYATFGSVHPFALLRFIVPSIVGNLSKDTALIGGGSIAGYVGFLPLFFSLFAPIKTNVVRFYWFIGLLSVGFALGKYSPVYIIGYYLVPGLRLFRQPEHFLILWTFSISILSGFGLEAIMRGNSQKKFMMFGAAVTVVLIMASALLTVMRPSWLQPIGRIRDLSAIVIETTIESLWTNMMFLLLTLFVLIKGKLLKPSGRPWIAATVVLVFIELCLFSRQVLLTTKYHDVLSWQNSTIATAIDRPFRLYVTPQAVRHPRSFAPWRYRYDQETSWLFRVMRPNIPLLYGISTADGYSSLVLSNLKRLVRSASDDPTGIDLTRASHDTLDLLSIKYILTSATDTRFRETDGFASIFSEQGLVLYENKRVLPRLFLTENGALQPESNIEVMHNTPQLAVVRTSLRYESTLVFSDMIYPGWQAFLDGRRVPLASYNRALKAVSVPSGTHTVAFMYNPRSLFFGLLFTMIGGMIIALLLLTAKAENRPCESR